MPNRGLPTADLSLDDLRLRRSVKWARYDADVLPAWIAEMDFPLAPPITDALRRAVEAGDCGYPPIGSSELGEAFTTYADRRLRWTTTPAAVVPVLDVMTGAAEILRRVAGPGDGVVITPPVYPPFFSTIAEVGLRVVEAPLARDGAGYALDLDAIDRALADARALLLCNPHNPTGMVLGREELLAVAAVAARHDAVVISDEIHAPLVHDGAVHQPFVALGGEAARRGVTLMSASKGWNVPGLKCAAVVTESGPMRDLADGFPEDVPHRTGHLGWIATCAAWSDGDAWLDETRARIAANHALLADLLAEHLPEVRPAQPRASYLAWLDCRELDLGADPVQVFLRHGRVALSPGRDFGTQGAGFVRLNVGTSPALVTEAVRRMAGAVAELRGAR
jgi:cystathionine beta-lyase